jgi:hypothetical protein
VNARHLSRLSGSPQPRSALAVRLLFAGALGPNPPQAGRLVLGPTFLLAGQRKNTQRKAYHFRQRGKEAIDRWASALGHAGDQRRFGRLNSCVLLA